MELKVKKVNPEAIIPKYAHLGDAGFDLYTCNDVSLQSMQRTQVSTGIALEIPDGYVGLIWDKSGLSHKQGIKTLGGVIDSGYRGEILVGIVNLDSQTQIFKKGSKVAQMIIQKKEQMEIKEVSNLSETARGVNGFGSTGV